MPGTAATLVTQTRVREGKDEAFAQWQQAMSQAAAECRGFIEQSIMPPSPPAQTDWVILPASTPGPWPGAGLAAPPPV